MGPAPYSRSVFLNCPFDPSYDSLLHALVFTVHDCGYVARCALEIDDSSVARMTKILQLIEECQYGIHDLSRTEPDPVHSLPRFNMPLELGLFLAAKRFGSRRQREKRCLIFDREKYRYQKFCSDIAGQDVRAHGAQVRSAMIEVRNWLNGFLKKEGILVPSGSIVHERYERFLVQLPEWCERLNLDRDELDFNDRTTLIAEWLKENSRVPPSATR